MGSLFEGPEVKPIDMSGINAALQKGYGAADFKPISLNAGGLTGRVSGGTASVTSSAGRKALVDRLASTSLNQAGELAGLRGQVGDAVSGLKASRLQEVENARKASVSNLRDNLARRRILGSSFASDALTRADLEFAQESDKVAAESFLQEIEMKNELINQEFEARRTAFSDRLSELNLQAEIGGNLAAAATDLLSNNAQIKAQLAGLEAQLRGDIGLRQSEMQAKLDAEAQSGAGSFFGKLAGTVLGPVGSEIGGELASSLF